MTDRTTGNDVRRIAGYIAEEYGLDTSVESWQGNRTRIYRVTFAEKDEYGPPFRTLHTVRGVGAKETYDLLVALRSGLWIGKKLFATERMAKSA